MTALECTMDDMAEPRHARPKGWKHLRRTLVGGGIVLAPVFLIVMFLTVTKLVRPTFGVWAWTVPVATEGCFLLLYGLDILLEWARKPKGWLRYSPYFFGAVSLVLNVWAYKHSLYGLLGHGVITVAFFAPVIAAESAVRDLAVTEDEMRMRAASADARQYAVDLCRSRRGRFWRWRIPVLLRTQILTGRLPDEVRESITQLLAQKKTSGWQAPVRDWVLGADGLNLEVQAESDSRKARESITGASPGAALEGVVVSPRGTPRSSSAKAVSGSLVKRANRLGRKADEDLLLGAMAEMEREGRIPTKTRVKAELPVGDVKAGQLVELYRRQQPVPISRAAGAR